MKAKFYSKLACNNEYLKTKIKYCDGRWTKKKFNFKGIPSKDNTEFICLTNVLVCLVYKMDENYYPQAFLVDWK